VNQPPGSPGWTADGGCPYIQKVPAFGRDSSQDFRIVLITMRDAGGPDSRCPLRCSGFGHPFLLVELPLLLATLTRLVFLALLAGLIALLPGLSALLAVPFHIICHD